MKRRLRVNPLSTRFKGKNKKPLWLAHAFLLTVCIGFLPATSFGQCINTSSFGSATVGTSDLNPVSISTCNYATEYATITVTGAGQYVFTSSDTTDYLTVTDGSNTVISHGYQPHTASFSSAGTYRLHVTVDDSCTQQSSCRATTVAYSPCLASTQFGSSTLGATNSTPVQFTTCQYASEYRVMNITDAGPYQFASGVSTDFMTFTDANDSVIVSGPTPLTVTAPASGTYRIHVLADPTCGTQNTCRTLSGVALVPLCGTYTIDQNMPTSGTNFQSFNAFATQINSLGVSCAVTVNVAAGTYMDQLTLSGISGLSSTNTLTINGGDASMTTISHDGSLSNATVLLDGVDYVTLRNITVENTKSIDDAWGIFLYNRADFNTIDSVIVNMAQVPSFEDIAGIVASNSLTSSSSGGDNAHDLTISYTTVNEGYYGYRHEGGNIGSSQTDSNITVMNSVFHNNIGYGIYFDDIAVFNLSGNTVSGSGLTSKDGFYLGDVNDWDIQSNMIWVADYAIYIFDGNFEATAPTSNSKIINNMLYSSDDEAMRVDDFEMCDIFHNTIKTDGTSTSAEAFAVNDIADVDMRNNIFYANAGEAFYSTDASSTFTSVTINYNVYYSVSGNVAYVGGSTFSDLSAWQTADATRNVNSVEGDPIFVSATDLHCLGSTANDVGDNTAGVTTDIDGDTRPASGSTTVDIGADEFTALGADLSLLSGEFVRGGCYSSNDSVRFTVQNVIGSAVNFATTPLVLNWSVSGTANSSGTITINSGTLASGDTITLEDDGVNMPTYGSYTLMANIDSSAANQSPLNDVLSPVMTTVNSLLTASPNMTVVTGPMDTVLLEASSPLMPSAGFFITEICHWAGTSTGAPTGGKPSWLTSDDYLEVTGAPNSDLGGFTLEQWSTSSLTSTYTFPSGTVLGSNGTAIIAIGTLNGGSDDPANAYYNGATTGSFSSSTQSGKILKDGAGNIVDAVGYAGSSTAGFTFPAASGVTSSDWSGGMGSVSSSWGMRLEGADSNSTAGWVQSSVSSQDPNTVNSMVTVPATPPVAGFSWSYNGMVVDTTLSIVVGPWMSNGVHKYVAAFNSASCGLVYDTATITVMIPCLENAPYAESFENSMWTPTTGFPYIDVIDSCWARAVTGSMIGWRVTTGSTPSPSTGPAGASDSSNYFYLEASSPAALGDTGQIWTPTVDLSTVTNPELRFDYHMFGSTMGDLYIGITTDGGMTWSTLDSIMGQQQTSSADPWMERVIDLSMYTGQVRVRFLGVRGTDFYGDMSLDNVRIDARPPSCPINDVPSVMSMTSCGPTPVTFTAMGNTQPNQGYFWMRSGDSAIVGMEDTYTTPPLTASADWYLGIGAIDDGVAKQHVGPLPSISTQGFGNFSNGQWFSVQDLFYLDSITVRSNGALSFQVRISEPGAAGAGSEIIRSDTISVSGAGDHQVFVGLAISPGNYFINIAFIANSGTGQLFRATGGAMYPYSIPGMVSIDSVNFTGSRYYYTFDWVVSEVCTSTLATASATLGTLPSTAFPYDVDFDSGLPCNWMTDNVGAEWTNVTDYNGNSLDSTAFMFIDDDAVGSGVITMSSMISPMFDTQGYDTLFMSFEHYFRTTLNTVGYVEVYDGMTWMAIDSFNTNTGAWSAPVMQSYDLTPYQNTNLQVRFRYDDGGDYGWYWAVDNFHMDGTPLPCENVVIDLLTDTWGSETTWSIVDTATGTVYASGGPYADATIANYTDTICLPLGIFYEFRINDSYGDGLFDGTNTGTYSVDIICPWGQNNVITGSGAFPYGGAAPLPNPSWDSTVFEVTCVVTCTDPDSLIAIAACTQAALSWGSEPNAVSTIQWGTAGFTPGTGALIPNANSPYLLTNLTEGTSYDFWVRDSCFSGSISNWVGPFTFTTDTMPMASFTATMNAAPHPDTVQYGFSAITSVNANSFWWDYGDGSNDTGAVTTHNYGMNGTYTVTLVVTNICGVDTVTQQIVVEGIGIDEYGFGNIGLYPNPNLGEFTVTGITEFGSDAKIEVINTVGAVIYSRELNASSQESILIDLQGMAPGMYQLRVSSSKGSGVKPFIIRN